MAKEAFRRVFSLSIFLFVILTCVYLFLHSSYFNVDKIYTTGLNYLSQEEVLALSKIKLGQNIFEVDSELTTRTLEAHPMVKQAYLIRHLPRSLEIKIEERQIWAIVPHNNEFLCIDNEGVVIDKKTTIDLSKYPLITFFKEPDHINLGQVVEPQGVSLIYKVWNKLNVSSRESISDFHYNNKKELIIYTIFGTEVRFGNEERLEEKIGYFEQILKLEEEFKQDGNEVLEYVDLRFEGQPVVKTKV